MHQGVNLELGLLVHQAAGLGQGLVYSLSDPRVQTHLGQERNTDRTMKPPPPSPRTKVAAPATWRAQNTPRPLGGDKAAAAEYRGDLELLAGV